MGTPGSTRNVPLLAASAVVVVAAIVAIAVGVNQAGSSGTPTAPPSASGSAASSATPSPSPTPSFIPYADCSTKSFGPVLQPLNPPADIHRYPAVPPVTI